MSRDCHLSWKRNSRKFTDKTGNGILGVFRKNTEIHGLYFGFCTKTYINIWKIVTHWLIFSFLIMSSSENESESQHDFEDPTSEASIKKRKKWSRGKLMTLSKESHTIYSKPRMFLSFLFPIFLFIKWNLTNWLKNKKDLTMHFKIRNYTERHGQDFPFKIRKSGYPCCEMAICPEREGKGCLETNPNAIIFHQSFIYIYIHIHTYICIYTIPQLNLAASPPPRGGLTGFFKSDWLVFKPEAPPPGG